MVRAILNGAKTQTRRVVKLRNGQYMPPSERKDPNGWRQMLRLCPYGQPGDRLWVREAWRTVAGADNIAPRDLMNVESFTAYEADEAKPQGMGKLRPSMFMPRWASRINLEVSGVRVERLNDISEEDARAEGLRAFPHKGGHAYAWREDDKHGHGSPTGAYRNLWESINGPASWDANPWVWCVAFKPVQP